MSKLFKNGFLINVPTALINISLHNLNVDNTDVVYENNYQLFKSHLV